MNIFWQEINYYKRVTLIWILVLSGMTFGYLGIFNSFADAAGQATKLLSNYPPQVLEALNLHISIFFTIYGFFAYLLTFMWLVGSIQAMNLGVGILSKEISAKTADFLLSKPITRVRMLTEKLAAAFALIVATDVIFIIAALGSAQFYAGGTFNEKIFVLIAATMFFVQMFFLAIGFLLGAVVPKIKTVVAVSLPTVFGFFIVSAFGSIVKNAHTEYITPFKYFDPIYIVDHSSYEPKYLWILAGVVIVSIASAYIYYLKKDIPSAT